MIRRPLPGILRVIAVSTLATAACLGLAACGSGSAKSPASAPVTATATTAGTTPQTTAAGATANAITRSLQEDLRKAGFHSGQVTGEFDAATTAALKNFQGSVGRLHHRRSLRLTASRPGPIMSANTTRPSTQEGGTTWPKNC